jgi:mannitol-specific phosphotransferase system IIBC component
VWPEKPSANDANRWYQVSYGLTSPRSLSTVSIAVGTLAESYISFGWLGPLLIMFPLGIFLGSIQRIFLREDSGLLFSSLGAVMVPQLLTVESQMVEYVAGLAQQTFVILLVLMPTLKSRREKVRASSRASTERKSGRTNQRDYSL